VDSAASRTPATDSPSGKYKEASFAGGLWTPVDFRGVGLMTGARVRW